MEVSAQKDGLAAYAMRENLSQGRHYSEVEHPYRGIYQRDRDRILHASAFRRLTAKTQVLVTGTNDHHRTRLTHTLEVSQVSRTIAKELRLNEALTEAIALVHDIGHPPFGHAGEAALHECMKEAGGFEHNKQGLRIVELLEQRYPDFPGLNLTWEVRESLAFHSKMPQATEVRPYKFGVLQPTLEAQVVDVADRLVYDIHDIDDALGVGLISLNDLQSIQTWRETESDLNAQYGKLPENRLIASVLRSILSTREKELISTIQERLQFMGVTSVEKVKFSSEPVVQENDNQSIKAGEIRAFLVEKVYHHPKVLNMTQQGSHKVRMLFHKYHELPSIMPHFHAERALSNSLTEAVGDYVSGMTDRLAEVEYRKLFQSNEK